MDKSIFLSVLLLSIPLVYTSAQNAELPDCAEEMVEETDSLGVYTRAFKNNRFMIVKNSTDDTLKFDLMQFNNAILIFVGVAGAGDCLDELSNMTTRFTSGETVTLTMNAFFNCDREYISLFGGSFGRKKELELFLKNKIESVRVETRKSIAFPERKTFVEVTFTPEQAQEFLRRMKCLVQG
jgi:hypothetical protein